MWFQLPEEWQALFWDGPQLFHHGPLHKGMARNASRTRSEEILVLKKIFKLQYQGYIDKGFVDFVQGCFAITKLMVDKEVMNIRVV